MSTATTRQHFSPITNKWEQCKASKTACRYGGEEAHKYSQEVLTEEGQKKFAKNLFQKLFGSKKQDATPSLEEPQASIIGQVRRNSTGALEVLSRDDVTPGGTGLYLFGEHTSEADARRLHGADPLKTYQNGECGDFANQLWNLNPHVEDCYVMSIPDEPVFGIHQFVKLEDGTYADSLGVWSEQQIVAYWKSHYPDAELKLYDDGEPTPPKDPDTKISNPDLYATVTEAINRRFQT